MSSRSIPASIRPPNIGDTSAEAAFRNFVEWQNAEESPGLVVRGAIGKAATPSIKKRSGVVRVCVGRAEGRVPVIAGADTINTRGFKQPVRWFHTGPDVAEPNKHKET